MIKTAEQILKEIGCITEVNEVSEFVFDHADFGNSGFYEEYFKIYGEDCKSVIGRIMKFTDGTVKSKLDYTNNLEYRRNVNIWEELQ